jgi:peptidase M23-like protein
VASAVGSACGPKLTVDNVDGNHIVLDIGNGAYAFYAHLIKASLLVKPGDKVTKGQPIAKLGNTGQRERITPALSDHERPIGHRQPRHPLRDRLVRLPGPDLPLKHLQRRQPPHRHLLQPKPSPTTRNPHQPATHGLGDHQLPRVKTIG